MQTRVAVVVMWMMCPMFLSACAPIAVQNVKRTLYLCESLRGPDADKGDGEVRFWLNASRAQVSRKLWNRSGEKAVSVALAQATSEEDRACLTHLQKEIRTREVTGW